MRLLQKVTKGKLLPLFIALLTLTITACDNESEDDGTMPMSEIEYDVAVANTSLGNVITDAQGMTLYFFTRDVNGTSACNGGCATNWPPFTVDNLRASPALDQTYFSTITREDGSSQVTYKGWPLYYFMNDNAAGDVNGENAGGNWYVAKPDYDVFLASQTVNDQETRYLVDDLGQSLYTFANDDANLSNCSGGCLDAWPIFGDQNLVIPSILNQDDFGNITTQGVSHATFLNQPLYYFNNDDNRGEINGHEANNVWFLQEIQ